MAYTNASKQTFITKKINTGNPNLPVLDFCSLNVHQLSKEILAMIGNPDNHGFIAEFGSQQGYVDVSNTAILGSYMERITNAQSQLLNFQANMVISFEAMESLIQDKRDEFKRQLEVKEKLHLSKINQYVQESEQYTQRTEELKTKNEYNRAVTQSLKDKTDAEVKEINVRIERDQIKNKLMSKVVENVDLNRLPDDLYTYVIASIFGNPERAFTDFNMNSRLAKFAEEDRKQDVRKKKIENEAAEIEKEHLKRKLDRDLDRDNE